MLLPIGSCQRLLRCWLGSLGFHLLEETLSESLPAGDKTKLWRTTPENYPPSTSELILPQF